LPAADDELIVLVRDLEVFHAEASHGEAYAEARGTRLLDIIRRVPVGLRFGSALQDLLKMIEAQEQGRREDT
jgi:hypothetical protein